MQELVKTTSDIAVVLTDILTAIRDSIRIVVTQINTELTSFVRSVSFVVSTIIIDLIDDIFELYPYEWVIVNRSILSLDSLLNFLIYNQIQRIEVIISNFTLLTDNLIKNFTTQLSSIDDTLTPQYTQRMFAIYGHIAEISVAINAPPSYLEEAIQNARFFALGIASSVGLSYEQFMLDWDTGLTQLLVRIKNSISLYKQYPQWIKVDIEEILVKPMYEIGKNSHREARDRVANISDIIVSIQELAANHKTLITQNQQTIDNLFELEIKPVLDEMTNSFDSWKEDNYDIRAKLIDSAIISLFVQLVSLRNEARQLITSLDYGGDLLLRVDKLSGDLRIEQEDKISDVTTRTFRRLVPDWLEEVKERVD